MPGQVACCRFHGCTEILHCRSECWKVLLWPCIFPDISVLTDKLILKRVREEGPHISVSPIKESVFAMLPTDLEKVLGSLKFLSSFFREVGKLPCLKKTLASLISVLRDSMNRESAHSSL
jgi:hypothetical protein